MRIITWGTFGLFLAIVAALALWPTNTCFRVLDTAIAQEQQANDSGNPFDGNKSKKSGGLHQLKPAAKTTPNAAIPKKASTPAQTAPTGYSYSTRRAREIESALSKVCNLEYIEVPFIDVKRELEDAYGLNIVLDQSALDDSLTEEELVNVQLRGISLSNALRLMLRDFNATYVVNNGVVRIISLANVTDLENLSQKMVNVSSLLNLINQKYGRLNSEQQESNEDSLQSAETLLQRTITNVVQPDIWKDTATIDIIGGVLVMYGPEVLLGEVSDFLQDLEAELKAQ